MNFANLIHQLAGEIKSTVRKYEKTRMKFIKAQSKHDFNIICYNNGLLPKYTEFKLHDASANLENFTVDFRRNLVNREIQNSLELRQKLSSELLTLNAEMENAIDPELLKQIKTVIEEYSIKEDIKIRNKMSKKLTKLYGRKMFLPEHTDSYINLSKYKLTQNEKYFLNLGINCHLKTNFYKQKKQLELELL